MLQFGQPDQVRQLRQLFESEMTQRLTDMIERLTDRKVLTYQSQVMFEADTHMRVFVAGDMSVQSLIYAAQAEREGRDTAKKVLMVLAGWDNSSVSTSERICRMGHWASTVHCRGLCSLR